MLLQQPEVQLKAIVRFFFKIVPGLYHLLIQEACRLPEGRFQVAFPAGDRHPGLHGFFRVPAAGGIALAPDVFNIVAHHDEIIRNAVAPLTFLPDGKALAHDAGFPVVITGMEPIGKHRGFLIIQLEHHPNGGVGDACIAVCLRSPGSGEFIDRHRNMGQVRKIPQRPPEIGAVGQQVPVPLPAVKRQKVQAARIFMGLRPVLPRALEAAGIAARVKLGFQCFTVQGEDRAVFAQAVQAGHKGIEETDGLGPGVTVGQGVSI